MKKLATALSTEGEKGGVVDTRKHVLVTVDSTLRFKGGGEMGWAEDAALLAPWPPVIARDSRRVILGRDVGVKVMLLR